MSKLINVERELEERAEKVLTGEQMDILHQTDYEVIQNSDGTYEDTMAGYYSNNLGDVINNIIETAQHYKQQEMHMML